MTKSYKEELKQSLLLLENEVLKKNLKVAIAFSHQNEDVVNIALAKEVGLNFDVFTLDTKKLFKESLQYQKQIEIFFGIKIKSFNAKCEDLEMLEKKVGENGIFDDIHLRKECCRIRKIEPLRNALHGYNGWITGVREEQSVTRIKTNLFEFDKEFGLLKFNPLSSWLNSDIDSYLKQNNIPRNLLYAKGFKSIGCEPCTRAVRDDEDIRAGRWWWENPEHKECGLHNQKQISYKLSGHLKRLENESIYILREVVANFSNPVMMYSIGKDSSVMLHLAQKAFYPAKIPFPLLHVDTMWKFKEMIEFRDQTVEKIGADLLVHINDDGKKMDINPFIHGSKIHTDIMKTDGLKQALNKYGFDAIIGGARRDEEKSRAKERIFSFRDKNHRWNPKDQRPELWNIYNTNINKAESVRVFPISNWTEADIWQYIKEENIPIVPLYLSKSRKVVEFDGMDILADDERIPKELLKTAKTKNVRFRTLGCYPLTGAVKSNATTLDQVIEETLASRTSEREGRAIDKDQDGSMEKKKMEGYF